MVRIKVNSKSNKSEEPITAKTATTANNSFDLPGHIVNLSTVLDSQPIMIANNFDTHTYTMNNTNTTDTTPSLILPTLSAAPLLPSNQSVFMALDQPQQQQPA